MKCALCENKTTWSSSFGTSFYLVCGECFNKLREKEDAVMVLEKIIEIGEKIEKLLTDSENVL